MNIRKLNLSDSNDYQTLIEHFGGEELLRQEYPLILEMIQNTRELRLSGALNTTEIGYNGYEDTYRVENLQLNQGNSQTGLGVKSYMSMVSSYPMLMMTGTTQDIKTGKVLYSFSDFTKNDTKFNYYSPIDNSLLSYTKGTRVLSKTTFYALGKVGGKNVFAQDPVICSTETDLRRQTPIISGITVNQPKEKSGSSVIRVVYNRRSDNSAAYIFPNAHDKYWCGTRYVDVYYPFSVQVELYGQGKEFVFDKTNPIDYNAVLATLNSTVVSGGEVHFNTALVDKIKWKLINDYTLLIDFSYESETDKNSWGVQMPLTDKQAEGTFDFHLDVQINYSLEGMPMTSTIIVTSEDLPYSSNIAHVKRSSILWGCIGENALIRTKTGGKRVQELSVGEMIYTENGYRKLANIVTGTENEMVSITIEGREPLLLTESHAIVAERRVMTAGELLPDDLIRMSDGSYQAITELKRVPYNGTVYSLELEQSEMIFANEMMVGDYKTVPGSELTTPICEPIDEELADELIRWNNDYQKRMQEIDT